MDYDCVVIGAGPAGLHCGTYLARFRRRVLIFHGGKSRAEWIPITHNFPGFPQGIAGTELLSLLRKQCQQYGAEIRRETARSVEGTDGHFIVETAGTTTSARKIVFATGVQDIPPEIPNPGRYKGHTIRHCPICDAYEATNRKMVVLGYGDRAVKKAVWLAHYTDDLTILTMGLGSLMDISEELRATLDRLGIRVIPNRIAAIQERGPELGTIIFDDGSKLENVYRGYSAMGLKPNSEIASAAGVELDAEDYIKVDHQQTSISGVYAIGDIVSGEIGQLSVAVGHAASAATDIHDSMLG